jgi:hypothetical protein
MRLSSSARGCRDDATVTWPYKRRMYHAAIPPTGRTASNTQSKPTVI